MVMARKNPPAGNREVKEALITDYTTRKGHINLDVELSTLRCLMSGKASDVLRAVDECSLVEQDFYPEQRRTIFRAVMNTARRAVHAGQGDVQVSPVEVMGTLQQQGRYNHAVATDFIQASAGDSMSGSVDNLWVLTRRVEILKRQRLWRGAEHIGTALLDVCRGGGLEHLDRVLEQVGHLQSLRDRLAGLDDEGEVA